MSRITIFTICVLSLPIAPYVGHAGPMDRNEHRYQSKMFYRWWGTPIIRELEKLPAEGSVDQLHTENGLMHLLRRKTLKLTIKQPRINGT